MQSKEMSDIMNNTLFCDFENLKNGSIDTLSNIERTDFVGSVTSEAYNIIG